MILLKLAGDSEALSRIGSCLITKLSRMPDVEIAAGPSGRGSGDGGTLAENIFFGLNY
jgi:hypothetical protein